MARYGRSLRLDARPCSRALRGSRAIAVYLGGNDVFDRAIADYSEAYADQNERDYNALRQAVEDDRIDARTGL